ncbi:helix-turn-helix domain-containing protein [Streptomyces sp. NPDC058623]|uniref:helix-turn-helix domain-containing protein n=1 Tax=Streptomyces sp. NPDC058623 TaxID=3346563 RepID=UPI0036576568
MSYLDGMDRHITDARRLGEALRALQQRSGCTLRDLESRMPISDSSLSRYFRGQTVPPWTVVQDLCRALGAESAEYRALWEAAERNEPRPPAVAAHHPEAAAGVAEAEVGEVAAPTPASAGATDSAGPRAASLRRRVWPLSGGRRACTLAGALAGAALGSVLTWCLLPSAPGAQADGAPVTRAGSAAEKPAGTAPETGEPATGGPGPADTVRIFVSRRTGACLDHSLDKRLRTFPCNGMSYQRWTLHRQPDGAFRLRNHATGACLAHGPDGLDTAACTAAASQKWVVTPWPDESVEVRSKATGACLADSAEAGLRALPCARTDHQRWG